MKEYSFSCGRCLAAPRWLIVVSRIAAQVRLIRAVNIHDIYLVITIANRAKHNFITVWTKSRIQFRGWIVRKVNLIKAVQIHNKNVEVATKVRVKNNLGA